MSAFQLRLARKANTQGQLGILWQIYTEVSRPAGRRDDHPNPSKTAYPVNPIYLHLPIVPGVKKLNTKHYNHGIVETELINNQTKKTHPTSQNRCTPTSKCYIKEKDGTKKKI